MEQISFRFAFISCAVLALATAISCKKEIAATTPSVSQVSQERVQQPLPTADPAIAYVAYGKPDAPANRHLMVMNADGSNQTVILTGVSATPSWSPDGHSILFNGTIGGQQGLWIVDVSVSTGKPTGSNLRMVSTNIGSPGGGRWSPVGNLIVFRSEALNADQNEDQNIYTVPITGGPASIVYSSPTGFFPSSIDWSPDGSKLVFAQWNNAWNTSDLTILDTSSHTTTTVVPTGSSLIHEPRWSQQGDRIAYNAAPPRTATFVYTIMPTANATPIKITAGTYQTWSPDASKLALAVSSKFSFDVITYAFNGGITQNVSGGNWPDWRRF